MKRLVWDLESSGHLNQNAIDYTKFPYRLKPDYKIHCVVTINVDTKEVSRFNSDMPFFYEAVKEELESADEWIFHNGLGFDTLVLLMALNLDFKVGYDGVDYIGGKVATITDTLVWSRLLNPDREGGHSLRSWGERTGTLKTEFKGPWDQWSQEMEDYCEDDCWATLAAYTALMNERGDYDWDSAYELEKVTDYAVSRYSHFGFKFNMELAKECVQDLTRKMKEIEEDVAPFLPEKSLTKTEGARAAPPKVQLKQDGTPSANLLKYCARIGAALKRDVHGKYFVVAEGQKFDLPLKCCPVNVKTRATLANQREIKEWLITEGWVPTVWGEKNLLLGPDKRPLSQEKFAARVERYVEDTKKSQFRECREEFLGNPDDLYDHLINSRFPKVITSPKFTVNADKDLCPNLEKLENPVPKKAVMWLTYRHRKNSILSDNGTGFIANCREDGRIATPAITCGASTGRFQHSLIANIPRVTSLYGDRVRSLFGTEYLQLGYDFASLEARIEGHYVSIFGGESLAQTLIAEKPNDIHTLTAKRLGISRDDAKTFGYALIYGAQPRKLAKQLNVSLKEAQKLFDAYWDSVPSLKKLKEVVTHFASTKGYVRGLDNRKLWFRSLHSILNLLIQSAGVTCAKKTNQLHLLKMEKEGILFDPFVHESLENRFALIIMYHDESQGECWNDDVAKRVEELGHEAARETSLFYNLNVPLAIEVQTGKTWKDCH